MIRHLAWHHVSASEANPRWLSSLIPCATELQASYRSVLFGHPLWRHIIYRHKCLSLDNLPFCNCLWLQTGVNESLLSYDWRMAKRPQPTAVLLWAVKQKTLRKFFFKQRCHYIGLYVILIVTYLMALKLEPLKSLEMRPASKLSFAADSASVTNAAMATPLPLKQSQKTQMIISHWLQCPTTEINWFNIENNNVRLISLPGLRFKSCHSAARPVMR